MAKRKIPADTDFFKYVNLNPKGRHTSDCYVRAIANGTGESYQDTLIGMAEMSVKTGYAVGDTALIAKYLESKGWVRCGQPKDRGQKFRVPRFLKSLRRNISGDAIICNAGSHHVTCIRYQEDSNCYKVEDIWDCTGGCVGVYFMKKAEA